MSDGFLIKGVLNADATVTPPVVGTPFKFEIAQADAWDLVTSWLWINQGAFNQMIGGKPRYISPGAGYASDSSGGVLTVDATNGMWRNGRKLGMIVNGTFVQAKCAVLLVHGDEVFGRAVTSGDWWQWLGNKWLTKPDNTNGLDQTLLDPAIFLPTGTAIPT